MFAKLCCAEKSSSVKLNWHQEPQLQPGSQSTKQDWRGVCVWASMSCSHYFFAFLPSNTCFIYLTFEPEGQTFVFCFSRTYAKFTVLDYLIWGESSHLSNSDSVFICWSLTGSLLLSGFCLQIYTHTICQLCTLRTISRLLKGKGLNTHLLFVLREKKWHALHCPDK